ncbi:MAG TPA: hypothetical protein VGV36_03365 [Solirubrobacteraceae bacterium]|nr:hypothetical protein [Solirubrobacteraceae bacterium]
MTADELLERYAARVGVPAPTPAERETLLAMAGVAAYASERLAAPLACWMAGRAGLAPQEAARLVREVVDGA